MDLSFKQINLLLMGCFIIFSFLQLNDPDAVLWVVIYGLAALFCFLFYKSTLKAHLVGLYSFVCFAYSIKLLIAQDVFFDSGCITGLSEPIREAFGILVVGGWMLVLFVKTNKGAKVPLIEA